MAPSSSSPSSWAASGPTQEPPDPSGPRDRVILINLLTQTMTVVETTAGSVIGDLVSGKSGPRPTSKSTIENLPRVEIVKAENDGEEDQCAVCLEEWENGDSAKVMPCKHRFHNGCIEKWLRINGCCPVCKRELPAGDEDDDMEGKSLGESEGDNRIRREIWVSFSLGSLRNRENEDHSSG